MRNNGDKEIKDWFVLYCNGYTRRKSKGVCGAKHLEHFLKFVIIRNLTHD
jgi:hypothetical protein